MRSRHAAGGSGDEGIVIYAKAWCFYCTCAKRLLESKGAPFIEIDVEAQPEEREEMIARSGRAAVAHVFIAGRSVGGSDDLHLLEAGGGLGRLLRRG